MATSTSAFKLPHTIISHVFCMSTNPTHEHQYISVHQFFLLSHPFCLFMFSFSSGSCTQLDLIHYPGEYSDGSLYTSEYTTLDQCKDGCLADVNCYGLDWHYPLEYCFFHYDQSNLDTSFSSSRASQFVKPPACF